MKETMRIHHDILLFWKSNTPTPPSFPPPSMYECKRMSYCKVGGGGGGMIPSNIAHCQSSQIMWGGNETCPPPPLEGAAPHQLLGGGTHTPVYGGWRGWEYKLF